MRHIFINSAILIALMLTAFAAGAQVDPQDQPAAQTPAHPYLTPSGSKGDWSRVRELSHDEEINVWSSHNRHTRCLFTGATDDFLFCEPVYARQGSGEYRFNRADVDKVRLEQGEHHFKTTIAVGTLAGVALGAALPTSNSGERVVGGLAGGLAGFLAGVIVAGPVAIFVPGHLVYERPHSPRKSQISAHPHQETAVEAPQHAGEVLQ